MTRSTAQSSSLSFHLDEDFVLEYSTKPVKFGFNGLGEIVYLRTYSRLKSDGTKERWWETVERAVNGTFSIQKDHINQEGLEWSEAKGQRLAKKMYERIFAFKFLPPGRGLSMMGTDAVHVKGLAAALQNCGFVSTETIHKNFSEPFCFMMDASACGIGVGFDTRGAGKITFVKPEGFLSHSVADSREGWVESLRLLLDAYSVGGPLPVFDYSLIRPAGQPLKTFGGVSGGPQPLIDLHIQLGRILAGSVGRKITVTNIADIMNLIGVCIVSGNVRRSAQIMFGEMDDQEYLNLKNKEVNPERAAWSWSSNNTVLGILGANYNDVGERASDDGEPGVTWLQNIRNYARMGHKDTRDEALGLNPCAEQPLFDRELCCLVESFPAHHETSDDYNETLACAYLYAKTVTLLKTHWPKTNRVMKKNRRIGTSMSGVTQFLDKFNHATLIEWCEAGYDHVQKMDKKYSDWFGVARSIRTTTIKPSGTVSLLAGAAAGMHYPESKFYIKNMRIANTSDMLPALRAAGYEIEPCVTDSYTSIVKIPVAVNVSRSRREVSMWEQLQLAALLQRHWSDNAVSVTVTFDPVTEGPQIKHALQYAQYSLKAVSFLPLLSEGAYPQMPEQAITEAEYNKMVYKLLPLDWTKSHAEAVADRFCDSDKCVI